MSPHNTPVEQRSAPLHTVAPSPRMLRAQAVQRLQVGLFGLALMLLLVGLANIIMDHARLADSAAGTPAHAGAASSGGDSDPLADIGVIPAPDPQGSAHRAAANPARPAH